MRPSGSKQLSTVFIGANGARVNFVLGAPGARLKFVFGARSAGLKVVKGAGRALPELWGV